MFNLHQRAFLLLIAIFLFTACGDDEPCANLEGKIHDDLRIQFPYGLNLDALVFEDLDGQEVVFNVISKVEKTEVVNANMEFPFKTENLEFVLFNENLDIYFKVVLLGSYATIDCPKMADPGNFINIIGPLAPEVAASSPGQSSNFIFVDIVEDEIVVQDSNVSSLLWMGAVFSDVYESSGDFENYFNFDIGIIGFRDPNTNISYIHTSTITE